MSPLPVCFLLKFIRWLNSLLAFLLVSSTAISSSIEFQILKVGLFKRTKFCSSKVPRKYFGIEAGVKLLEQEQCTNSEKKHLQFEAIETVLLGNFFGISLYWRSYTGSLNSLSRFAVGKQVPPFKQLKPVSVRSAFLKFVLDFESFASTWLMLPWFVPPAICG
jgi:hypothetical protein